MIPYSRHTITAEDEQAVLRVLRSDWLTTGPMVPRFEDALRERVGARYAVAVSSGTAALTLAVKAALDDVCDEWEAVVPALSFVATANAVATIDYSDKRLRFVDVDDDGLAVFPGVTDIFVPVHYAGRPRRIDAWEATVIIEDACHALGAIDHDGYPVGACRHSLACCFSFHPVKPITTCEGGAITTNDADLARQLRRLRDNGRENGLCYEPSGNYRMSDIQAALGLSQLERLERTSYVRGMFVKDYWLSWLGKAEEYGAPLSLPRPTIQPAKSSWHLFPVRFRDRSTRDRVKLYLNQHGYGAQVHYDPPIHKHPAYQHYNVSLPNAERWADTELSLPLWAGMPDDTPAKVSELIREVLSE